MKETERLPLPSSPSTLCFNKEEFMKEDFNVDQFVVECRRKVSLEGLRDDLALYQRILQSAMIELINKDYADFVNLSSNLVGLDKAINNLSTPLGQLREQVLTVRNAMDASIQDVEQKLQKQADIREKKKCMQRLINIIKSVEKIEKLLGIQHKGDNESYTYYTSELSGQLIERVATEFNKLQFYVIKSRNMSLVTEIKPRIANITSTLQYSLEGLFREGLDNGQVDVLRQCLRTYATIDKMRDAENLFRQHIVKSYVEEYVNEKYLQDHPLGLKGMYAKVLEFVPKYCKKLQEAVAAPIQGSGDAVRGYDFLVNAVWPEIVANIEARTPSIFAPGNPNTFHEKYSVSMDFLEKFERQCGSQASVKRLRSHPSYNTFMSKWSLPVYFQIRFQEIAGALETTLCSPFDKAPEGSSFQLITTDMLLQCLIQCWQPSIFLPPLSHRFWKLSLQLIARYATWIGEVSQQELVHTALPRNDSDMSLSSRGSEVNLSSRGSDSNLSIRGREDSRSPVPSGTRASPVPSVGARSSPVPPEMPKITLDQLVALVTDAQLICDQLPEWLQKYVTPCLVQIGLQDASVLEESLTEGRNGVQSELSKFVTFIVEELAVQCNSHLKLVNDIPRLYRRTNREVPNKASAYTNAVLKPLSDFLTEQEKNISPELKTEISNRVIEQVSQQYLNITNDVLTSVRKMEESLKRLKRAKGTSTSNSQGLSDDDKIRLQLYLDVEHFGKQIDSLCIKKGDQKIYSQLHEMVVAARKSNAKETGPD